MVAVARLVAGDGVERDRGIHDRPGEHAVGRRARPHVAEVGADRDASQARLQADEPAARRGDADRAAQVAGVGEPDHPRGDGGRAPARRASRREVGIPRVSGRAVARVLGDRPQTELGRVRLAHDDCAGFPKPSHVHAVVVGDPVAERGAALRRRKAFGRRQQILDPDRDAAEGSCVARLHRVGLGERALRAQRDEGVQARVQPLDRRERRLDELACGHLAGTHGCRLVESAQPEEVVGRRHGAENLLPRRAPTNRAGRPRGRGRAARAASRCRRSRPRSAA